MNKIKILVVEDETIVALDIRSALKQLDYDVTDIVTNYNDALKSVHENKPDIVLMDINLENSKDGIETAHAIKNVFDDIPIIYLTAYSDDKTIQRAIETNPIGYLIKPFKREELKTTIALGLHKMNKGVTVIEEAHQELGDQYTYDLENGSLFCKGMPVKLSLKESILLKLLIEAKGQIVPFNELEYNIWPDEPISNSTLRTLVYRIRAKLDYKFIETIPSFGCKLTPLQ